MKGQASYELMILIAFLIMISVLYVSAFRNQFQPDIVEKQEKINNICSDIANKINNAIYFGHGFVQTVNLPDKINDLNYSITVYNDFISCKIDDYGSMQNFIAENITNTTHNPPFELPIREIKIENVVGTIVIS